MLKIFSILILMALGVMLLSNLKKVTILQKIIASAVVAFFFAWGIYGFVNLYQETSLQQKSDDIVTITALNQKNDKADGTEIVFRGASVDGVWYHATQLCERTTWIKNDDVTLQWRSYEQPQGLEDSISFQMPAGTERILVFNSNKWQGQVRVSIKETKLIWDCFADNIETTDIAFSLPNVQVPTIVNKKISLMIFAGVFLILFILFFKNDEPKKDLETSIKGREVWGDILRIICTFTVIWLHCTCDNAYTNFSPIDRVWYNRLYVNCFTTFAVPCFFMVSGAFLLRKYQSIETIWKKRIPRVYIPLLFWSIGYILVDIYVWKDGRDFFKAILKATMTAQYWHLWFVYAIVGLYILLPIISRLYHALQLKEKIYLLIVILGIPCLIHDITILTERTETIPGFALDFPQLGLFILGYFLYENRIFLPRKIWIYPIIFFIGFAATVLGTYYVSLEAEIPMKSLFSNGSFGVILMAGALFSMTLQLEEFWKKQNIAIQNVIHYWGQITMGIYFIHMFILLFIGNHIMNAFLGFSANNGSMINMFFGAVVYFIFSTVICWCGSQIPIVRKLFM